MELETAVFSLGGETKIKVSKISLLYMFSMV